LGNDLDSWGLSSEQQKTILSQTGYEKVFALLPEHIEVWQLLMTIRTQMRFNNGRVVGFDYTAIQAGIQLSGLSVSPHTFSKLQLIESFILEFK